MMGREVEQLEITPGMETIKIDVSDYQNGIYHAVLKNKELIISNGKFIVMK